VDLGSSCFFHLLPGFCLVLDSRGRLGGKVGSACEEFEKMRLVYWVNVSESQELWCQLPGLSDVKG